MDRISEGSPRLVARMAGAFYLITILSGIFVISSKLVISGDAAATAANILAHRSLFEMGFTVFLIEMVCQIITTVLIYQLLKPAGRTVALVAVCLGLAGCIIKTFAGLFYIAPLVILTDAQYLNVFSLEQLQALSLFLLNLFNQGAAIGLVFLGLYGLLTGYLMIKSTFLPRALGFFTAVGGVGWLCFLHPPLGYSLFPYIALLGVTLLILWLLIFGVNEDRWREQARLAATG